jgi:hypothetical protein
MVAVYFTTENRYKNFSQVFWTVLLNLNITALFQGEKCPVPQTHPLKEFFYCVVSYIP